MADIEIKVPSLGESENEATLVSWMVQEGDAVEAEDMLAEIESDKITMELPAIEAGIVKEMRKQAGDTVEPGEVIGLIDTSQAPKQTRKRQKPAAKQEKAAAKPAEKESAKPEEQVAAKPAEVGQSESASAVAPAAETVPASPVVSVQAHAPMDTGVAERQEERLPMSGLRRRVAQRLKDAQNTAAMLTTFNEVNMQPVMDLRARYKNAFQEKHGVSLGFMSFFVRACAHAAARFPAVNAYIDHDEIVYHNYMDIGIAVSTEKGLVVPVLRDAGLMGFADIEKGVADLAHRAREGGLMPDDLKGGTFSITNGGVFGSLLSTPILNPPQSAILGMHAINKRPVVENDQIVIRPMMYVALTYDHRLIDGREAVQFLVAVKEYLEQPGLTLLDL